MRQITKKEIIKRNPNYNFEISQLPDDWQGTALDILDLPISGNEKIWIIFSAEGNGILSERGVLRNFAKLADDMLYANTGLSEGMRGWPVYDCEEIYYNLLRPLVIEKIKTWEELAQMLKGLLEEDFVSFRDPTPKEIEYAKSLQPLADKYLEESTEEAILRIINQKDIF